MSETYRDFNREPSVPHQCLYVSDDGRRCRARAMLNEYRCYSHRDRVIPTVIENEPFEIAHLNDRNAIQQALAGVAARLACNRMDLKRAGLLAYTLQVAAINLGAAKAAPEPTPAPDAATS